MRISHNAVQWIIKLVCICFLVQMYISLPAWCYLLRTVPLAPVIPGFVLLHWLEILLFISIQLCLIILIIKQIRWAVAILIASIAIMIVADATRLQPWVFLYVLILASVLVFDVKSKKGILLSWQIILSCTYFWSGIQKLNPHFVKELAPWLMEFSGHSQFFEAHSLISYILPLFESLAAIGLWFNFTRRIALFVLFLMHLFILISLGPFGHNWNMVIWPWNILFATFLILLFWNKTDYGQAIKKPFILLVVFLLGFMPLFNILNKWQHFLSAGFYSGMAPEAIFYYNANDQGKMPKDALPFTFQISGTNEEFIALDYWALENLQVPLYPENYTYKAVAKEICNCVSNKNSAGIRINHKERFRDRQWVEDINCWKLKK